MPAVCVLLEQKKDENREWDDALLSAKFDAYLGRRARQGPEVEKQRWRSIGELVEKIRSMGVALAGREAALYERMYRNSPEGIVTRSQFAVVMRKAFNLEIAPLHGAVNKKEATFINSLFNSFDERQQDFVDWRLILLMVRLLKEPWQHPIDHLRWGFALLGAEGSFDLKGQPPFEATIADIKDILFALFSLKSRPDLIKLVDTTFQRLSTLNLDLARRVRKATTQRLVRGQMDDETTPANSTNKEDATKGRKKSIFSNGGSVIDDLLCDMALFEELCATEPLASALSGPAECFGSKDKAVWLFRIERDHYHPLVLRRVRSIRRERRIEHKALKFYQEHQPLKRWRFKGWRLLAAHERRVKTKLRAMIRAVIAGNTRGAFDSWLRETLLSIRVRDLQRVVRGGLGRSDARWAIFVKGLIVSVQAGVRAHLKRAEFKHRLEQRYWAATEIQRHARAAQARRLALYRLFDHVDREKRRLKKQQEAWRDRTLVWAARRVQAAYRARLARKRLAEERAKQLAVALLAHEMGELDKENLRKRRIYEHMLVEWYDQRREKLQQAILYEDFTNAEKAKIVSRRRAKETEKRKQKRQREEHLKNILEQRRIEEWIAEWEKLKIDRVAALKEKLCHCHEKPETPEEEAIRSKLISDIKKRIKVILQRDTEVTLELADARKIAFEEVIEQRLKDEEFNVDEEQRDAADAYYAAEAAKSEAIRIKADREIDRTRNVMASRIQRHFGFYRARKMLRNLCINRFTKEYDAEAQAYYYRDARTGITQWRKPYALGSDYDIRVKHRWIVFKDETDVPYFYNAATLEMQWEVPHGTKLCERCRAAFAQKFCNELENFVCNNCYDDDHAELTQEERNKISWKVIDGSLPEAATTDLNALHNYNPLGRHLLKHEEDNQAQEEKKKILPISFLPGQDDLNSEYTDERTQESASTIFTKAKTISDAASPTALESAKTNTLSELKTIQSPTTCLESPTSPESIASLPRSPSETSLTSAASKRRSKRRRNKQESLLTTAQRAAADYLNEAQSRFENIRAKRAEEICVTADGPNITAADFPNCRNPSHTVNSPDSSANTSSQYWQKETDSSVCTSILDYLLESAAPSAPQIDND